MRLRIFNRCFFTALGITVMSSLNAQLVAWSFSAPDTKGDETAVAATFKDAGIKAAVLTRGSGLLNTNKYTRSFMSKLSLAGTASNNRDAASVSKQFYECSVLPVKGTVVSLSALHVKLRPGAGGTFFYRWTYSLNGKEFKELGSGDQLIKLDYKKPDGVLQPELDLSGISELQQVNGKKGVVFRLHVWGGSNPETATFSIGRSDAGNSKSYVLWIDGAVKTQD